MPGISKLTGTWELDYISGPRIEINDLFSNSKPAITFDIAGNRVSGNSSCHNFNGPLKEDGSKINFTEPVALQK